MIAKRLSDLEKEKRPSNHSKNFEITIFPRRSQAADKLARSPVTMSEEGEYKSRWLDIIKGCLSQEDLFAADQSEEQSYHSPSPSAFSRWSGSYAASRLISPETSNVGYYEYLRILQPPLRTALDPHGNVILATIRFKTHGKDDLRSENRELMDSKCPLCRQLFHDSSNL